MWRQAVCCEWGITHSDPSKVIRLITDSGTLRAMAKAGGVEVEEDDDEEGEEVRGSVEKGVAVQGGAAAGRKVAFDMDGVDAAKWILVYRDRREVRWG